MINQVALEAEVNSDREDDLLILEDMEILN